MFKYRPRPRWHGGVVFDGHTRDAGSITYSRNKLSANISSWSWCCGINKFLVISDSYYSGNPSL